MLKPIKINYRKFIEENFQVSDKDTLIPIPFRLNKVQAKYSDILSNEYPEMEGVREIVLKARQEGMSSFILALFATDFLLRPYSVSICISHRKDATDILFKKVKSYIDSYFRVLAKKNNIDPDLIAKQFLKSDNRNLLENATNGAVFYIGTAGAKVGGRGGTARNILFSETAFYQDTDLITAQEIVVGTAQQVPQGRGMIFLESTANGVGNYYHETWEKAMRGESTYKPRFFGWQEFYTKEWVEEKRKEFPNDRMWRQEYPCLGGETIVDYHGFSLIKDHPHVLKKGLKMTYVLKTEMGREIIITEDHPIFDGINYIPLHSLKNKDKIALLSPSFSENKQQNINVNFGISSVRGQVEINEDMASFIGIFMGDGSLSGHGSYTLSIVCDNKDGDFINYTKTLIKKLFVKPSERLVGSKKGGTEIRVTNQRFKELFLSLDLICCNSLNVAKRYVHVPFYIFKSPPFVIKKFLQGIFETDGFVGNKSPRIVLFSKYEQFLRDIQFLLLGFGINSRIKVADKIAGDGHKYIGRELRLNGLEVKKFNEEIGFLSKRKQDRFKTHSFNGHYMIKNEMYDYVKSITQNKIVDVYDLNTDRGYFSANGIWVHNCDYDEAFVVSGSPYFNTDLLKKALNEHHLPIRQGKFAADGEFN
jgi:intein/homing endonuclease